MYLCAEHVAVAGSIAVSVGLTASAMNAVAKTATRLVGQLLTSALISEDF